MIAKKGDGLVELINIYAGDLTLKVCKKCQKTFDENKYDDDSPARDLGDIFIANSDDIAVKDICPECREGFGIMNLMGFRPQ